MSRAKWVPVVFRRTSCWPSPGGTCESEVVRLGQCHRVWLAVRRLCLGASGVSCRFALAHVEVRLDPVHEHGSRPAVLDRLPGIPETLLWAAGGGVSPLDFARRRLSSYRVSRVHRTRVEREPPSPERRATRYARREAAGCRPQGNGSTLLRFYASTVPPATSHGRSIPVPANRR